MKKNNLFETGLRIVGVYFLSQIPFSLTSIMFSFSQDSSEYITDLALYRSAIFTTPFILIILGSLLLFRASNIASKVVGKDQDPDEIPKQYSELPLWIIIIGLFYLVSSFPKMIQEIIKLPISSPEWYWWSQITSNALISIFSLVFIFKSKKVEAFIIKHSSS